MANGYRAPAALPCHRTGTGSACWTVQVVAEPLALAHGATSKAPSCAASRPGSSSAGPAAPDVVRSSRYGSGSGVAGGIAAPRLPCPVVVVRLYTQPGWTTRLKVPLTGWMSAWRMNQVAGFALSGRKSLAHTWTVRPESLRPPVTRTVIRRAVLAVVVSTIVLNPSRAPDTSVTYEPLARLPSRYPLAEST